MYDSKQIIPEHIIGALVLRNLTIYSLSWLNYYDWSFFGYAGMKESYLDSESYIHASLPLRSPHKIP